MPIAQEIPPHKRMRRRASIISSDSSKHHRPVLTSLLSRKPTRRPTTKSARNLGDSASYASGDSDESSSLHAVQHDPTLSRHPALTRQGVRGRKPRKIIADDEEWKNVDDVPRSQLKGPQKWDPWPDALLLYNSFSDYCLSLFEDFAIISFGFSSVDLLSTGLSLNLQHLGGYLQPLGLRGAARKEESGGKLTGEDEGRCIF
ncbi:hypothetical protein B0H10DRAFT_1969896 [Mycena sp. CBHHK59/15]|nr:hypothetical protein B0H10DRAFT_1969896 [Mycena sp. CBHHK59/15]